MQLYVQQHNAEHRADTDTRASVIVYIKHQNKTM